MIKIFLTSTLLFVLAIVGSTKYFLNTIRDEQYKPERLVDIKPESLPYLQNRPAATRGKILAVVTSTRIFGEDKKTGFELTELARAYYVFLANGFDVDIASPLGGEPPMILDDEDMAEFDYAFLNDQQAQSKLTNSLALDAVVGDDYAGIYLVGGKGTMFDFPDNSALQSLIRSHYEMGKVIAAVCHGPAALVNVRLSDGRHLLEGKRISGFTNEEELFLLPDAREIFPFLLQDALEAAGASFVAGPPYLKKTVGSENLLSGQNPWSVWELAESMVEQLGYQPVPRERSAEENSVDILLAYHHQGYQAAHELMENILLQEKRPVKRLLLGMHSLVAVMQREPGKALDLFRLAKAAKRFSRQNAGVSENKPSFAHAIGLKVL